MNQKRLPVEEDTDNNEKFANLSPEDTHSSLFSRRVIKEIIFRLSILILVFSCLEFFTRIVGGRPFPNIPYADSDYEVEWELKKNYDNDSWLVRPNPDGSRTPIRIKTNSYGLRGGNFPIQKPQDEFRIIFLGDSVVFGFLLNENETLPVKLEKRLEELFAAKKIRVLNAGVDGYTTFQEYYFLKRRGITVSPDLVLLGFVLNDVFESHIVTKAKGGSGNYCGLAGKKSFVRSFLRFASHSAIFTQTFFRYIEIKNRKIIEKRKKEDVHYRSIGEIYDTARLFDEPVSSEIEKAWQDAENDLVTLKKFTDEKNIPLIIIVFPFAGQVIDKVWSFKPQERLSAFCSKYEIPFLDLSKAFMDYPEPINLYLLKDGSHLSPEGTDYIGKMITGFLKNYIHPPSPNLSKSDN